jgi:hypothetical protein
MRARVVTVVAAVGVGLVAFGLLVTLGNGVRRERTIDAAAVAAVAPAPVPPELFGMHEHRLGAGQPSAWPSVPVGALRLWDTGTMWWQLQPTPDRFEWTSLDQQVATATAQGSKVLLTLGQTPTWAASDPTAPSPYGSPGAPSPPRDLADWNRYVQAVVSRYQGRIEAYEIWNEPNDPTYYSGSPQQLAAMAQQAAAVIHATDPQAKVVTPGVVVRSGLPWLDSFLAAGGAQGSDVVGVHLYTRSLETPEATLPLINKLRPLLSRRGLAAKPVWNTETGWGRAQASRAGPAKFYTGSLSRAIVARAYLMTLIGGVQRYYFYAWNNNWVGLRLADDADGLLPNTAAAAYGRTYQWLVGAVFRGCTRRADGLWTCRLNRPGVLETVTWSDKRAVRVVAPSGTTTLSRLFGTDVPMRSGAAVSVGAEPVLFTGPGPSIVR